ALKYTRISHSPCEQSNEERSMKEIPETPVDKTENEFVLEQVEEAVIAQEEELVEDLGDAEPPWESRIEEHAVKETTVDAKEDISPRQIEESSPSEYEDDAEVDFSQPSIYDSSDEEDTEDFDQDTDTIEDLCKEVEEFTEEHKEMELTEPPKTPIPRPLPPNTSFKWVQSLTYNFTYSLKYGLLETDGQLRALCGFKSKRKMARTQSWCTKFNKVPCFTSKYTDWYHDQLHGSWKTFGHQGEILLFKPPEWKHVDQDGCGFKSKAWNPGLYPDIRRPGSLKICLELLRSFACLVWDPGGYWHFKH
ncbi:hypothetical protein S245_066700, partial [Arachis hypogaea]